ncbi:MAG: manganese efflux pump MntP family protein [Spirochaetaceae bacterium]|jgi:putative Mn2+ efflux pump MntP|nr:manganese efflux pump MntP family protein [Spirochaetaceae bacterium]
MSIIELILIAIGLSMDAFAVAVTTGLSLRKITLGSMVIVGLYFGIFQAVMPLIGYFLGARFADRITAFDHWIAVVLLTIIGGKMIAEAFSKEKDDSSAEAVSLGPRKMLPLAVATSIDALAVGVSFAFLKVAIVPAATSIGVITFLLSAAGVKIGCIFGIKFKSKAEIAGGVILILLGLKILLEHLGILNL